VYPFFPLEERGAKGTHQKSEGKAAVKCDQGEHLFGNPSTGRQAKEICNGSKARHRLEKRKKSEELRRAADMDKRGRIVLETERAAGRKSQRRTVSGGRSQ